MCIASLQPIRTSATSTSSPITKSSGVQGVPAAPVTPVLEGGACHAAAAAAAAAALVNMPVSQRGSSPRVSSSSNYSDDLAASAASKAATTAIFGLRLSSAGGSISSTPSSPPSDTQQGPGSSGSSSSTPFNALKDALTTRKTSKDIKGSKRRSTSSSSSSGNKRRDFNRAADTYSSGRRNSKEREYFSRNSLSNTPAPSSSYEPVKLSTSSSSVAEGHLSRDQERRTLSQAQPDYRVIDPLPVKMDYKETSPLPAQLTAVTSPSPAKSTASTGTMTTPEVATGRSSTGLQESTVPGLLQLLPEQVLDQAVGDLLVVYKELDKAHNTLEAVLCRSRALEADNVVLRAGYMDVEQQLSWTKEELSAAQSGVSALAAVSLQLQQDNQELGSTVVNLQAELATTQEALVCSQSQAAAAVDKAHNTLEAVMCRSRVLQADFDELRAAYMGMEQELGSTKVELAATQEALVCSQSQAAAAVAQYGALEQACMQAAPVVTQLLQDYDGMAAEALLLSSSNSRLVDTNMEVTAERDEALQGLQLLAECCVAQNAELTRCKEQLASVQSEAAVQMQEMLLLQQSNQQLHTMVAGLQAQCAARDECILAL